MDKFVGEDRTQQIFAFRDKVEALIKEKAGAQNVTLLGAATGIFTGCVDFIAWYLREVVKALDGFFESEGLPWAKFHVFRPDVYGENLTREDEE